MTYPKPADYPPWLRAIIVITLALFVTNAFFFLAPLISFFTAKPPIVTGTMLISGIGTLAATFAGAWLAFKFATLKSEKERIDAQVAAGNRALFTLTWMWSELKQHQKEIIDPSRGKPDAWLNLNVTPPLKGDLSFDADELSFVMQSSGPVFQHLFLEEERYRLAAHLIEEHRRLTIGHAWPRLEAAGLQVGDNRAPLDI